MNVLLINPRTVGYSRSITVPLGLLSIASCLQAAGHKVRLYDRTVEKLNIEEVFKSFSPDLTGVSLVSTKPIRDALFVSEYAKRFSVPVIWGGPLASEMPNAVLSHDCVDAVSISEGEETWLELVAAYSSGHKDLSVIKGLAIRASDSKTVFTQQRDFIDLGQLPAIDWSLIDVPKYFQASYECRKMLYLYSAKGCPHSCTFCYNKDFHRCIYRRRPLEAVLDEIKYLVTNYGMDGVYFADETWCRDRAEMHRICDSLRELNLNFVWGCQTRIGVFSREDFEYMHRSGCRWIFFGVESGSKDILKRMNKSIPYDKIAGTFSDCKKAGIVSIASFIIGFPEETFEDLTKTVELIEKLDTTLINCNYFAVVPGSDIFYKLTEENLYPKIKDIRHVADLKPIERIEYNLCEVPDRELKVIRSWYMWRSFTSGKVTDNKGKFSFAKKVISDAFKSLKGNGLKFFIGSAINSVAEFLSIFWYSHAYPRIVAKYGIDRK